MTAIYIFEYIQGTSTFFHLQTFTTGAAPIMIGVSCNRIICATTGNTLHQLQYNTGTGVFEAFTGQTTIAVPDAPVTMVFNDALQELYVGTNSKGALPGRYL